MPAAQSTAARSSPSGLSEMPGLIAKSENLDITTLHEHFSPHQEFCRCGERGTAPNYIAAAGSCPSFTRPYFLQIQTTIGIHHQGLIHGQIHEPMKRIAYTATSRAASRRISDRVAAPGAANSMSTTGNTSVRSWITV